MREIVNRIVFVFAIVMSISAFANAQEMMKKDDMKKDDGMMKKDAMMKKDVSMMAMPYDKNLPTVAIIKADWCPYCKNVDPVMMGLMDDYKGKVNFVVFDVTDDSTKAEAMKTAKTLGLTKFYTSNKGKTSTVAVLKNNKVVYKTSNNANRDQYVMQFDKALN